MTETPEMPQVYTRRLLLRPFAEQDFPAFMGYHSLPETYRYLFKVQPDPQAIRERFERALNPRAEHDGDEVRWAIVKHPEGILTGEVMIRMTCKASGQAEIGCIFAPSFHRQGIASEALTALIGVVFEHYDLHRLYASIDIRNTGSYTLFSKLGWKQEGCLIESQWVNGEWTSRYIYAMLARNWQASGV